MFSDTKNRLLKVLKDDSWACLPAMYFRLLRDTLKQNGWEKFNWLPAGIATPFVSSDHKEVVDVCLLTLQGEGLIETRKSFYACPYAGYFEYLEFRLTKHGVRAAAMLSA